MNKISTLLFLTSSYAVAAPSAGQMEFFESRIRPVLAQECYECHSEAGKQKGGLVLDSRPGWQVGGDSGAAIVPGNVSTSLLLDSIRHTHDDLKMPKNGAKLDDSVIADFEKWIAEGAFDPRDKAPTAEQLAKETDWSAVLERRKQWWCFQPVKTGLFPKELPPAALAAAIDQQLLAKLKEQGLSPAPLADPTTLIRRASYVLTGLPPTPEAVTAFVQAAKSSDQAYAQLVDRLLASTQYGESWARHWLDWVRYAESYGSEGDPAIPYAWRYRDYMIRAFNEDVPYPQLVREAIAGDLLPNPRLCDGINESALGIGQLRMVLHGFSPTDSLDEMVNFTDNQIDTVTKTFQALTVSCARCHNHKFDAISQADFYSLFGIFTSTKPAVVDVNAPDVGLTERAELVKLKQQIKAAVGKAWVQAAEKLPVRPTPPQAPNPKATLAWNLEKDHWFTDGHGVENGATKAGEFSVDLQGQGIIARVYPGGIFSDLVSTKDRGVIMSPRFKCTGGTLWMRVAGAGGVKAKYVVQNYPRTGTIHKAKELTEPKDETLGWHKLDLNYWKGDDLFIQCTTVSDMPAEIRTDARSWFGMTEVFITESEDAPPSVVIGGDPRQAVSSWLAGNMTDEQANLLGLLLRTGKLPNDLKTIPEAAPLLARYREVEARLPMPTRAPGVLEADSYDAALFVRGDHKQPSEKVARRFLDGINPTPYHTTGSGRLELAQSLTDPKNPLTSRVIVNRLWHHVFGRGIVGTTDNFGRLGELPSHPELLDALADHFQSSGGSMKHLIHAMLLTQAFQRSDAAPAQAQVKDPENKLLSHWTVRRLEAESIRDSVLMLSGNLDNQMYGNPVDAQAGRRSIYLRVIRNNLNPFLSAFDMPVPSSTRGRRDVTNVPAQSLALLNDPTIMGWTADWAHRALSLPNAEARAQRMFLQSLGRQATAQELSAALKFVKLSSDFAQQQKATLDKLAARKSEIELRIQNIMAPVRTRLAESLGEMPVNDAPKPYAEWTFEKDGSDSQGHLPLQFQGAAHIENGALILDGSSALARSAPLPKSLSAKTLEAWVILDTLDQKGGGVMTVQDKRGTIFDAIVYAEKAPQQWLSGSNNHRRTQSFSGTVDQDAAKRPVYIAITYDGNKVTGYRDGLPYGVPYSSEESAQFLAGDSEILLGCRHGKGGGNRMLKGRILRARLHDRALSAAEIELSRHLEQATLTERDVLKALTDPQRQEITALKAELEEANQQWVSLTEGSKIQDPAVAGWESLALSLINLKEFVYLR